MEYGSLMEGGDKAIGISSATREIHAARCNVCSFVGQIHINRGAAEADLEQHLGTEEHRTVLMMAAAAELERRLMA